MREALRINKFIRNLLLMYMMFGECRTSTRRVSDLEMLFLLYEI